MYVYRAVKFYVSIDTTLSRDSPAGVQVTDACFRSNIQTVCNVSDIDLSALQAELAMQLDKFTNLGSGWSLVSIDTCLIHIASFNPLVGSSYIDLPPF